MTNYSVKDVDEFIAAAPPEARPHLRAVRSAMTAAVPDAQEGLRYGKPYYTLHGMLAGFDAYKRHIGVEIWTDKLDEKDRAALEAKGYKTGSRTLQVAFDQAVPSAIIRRMVKAQAKANAKAIADRSKT